MVFKTDGKNEMYTGKRCMYTLFVTILINFLMIATLLPIVQSDSPYISNLNTHKQPSATANQPPIFGTPTPANGSLNTSLNLTWSIPINDPEGDPLLWTIQCSNTQSTIGCAQTNGTKSLVLTGLLYATTYKVWVNATDLNSSGLYTRKWYTFSTTTANLINNPPLFGTPSPTNGSTGNLLGFTWSIPINDPEGNNFTWTIQCSNGQTNNASSATNGTKTLLLSGLIFVTTYTIWVNATDPTGSGQYTRQWYTFTTRQNSPPVFGTPTPTNGSTGNLLSLSWSIQINDPEGNTFSWTIQCSNGQKTNGTGTSNGTKSVSLIGLKYSTIYKVWVNATDPTGSGIYTRKWYTFTTKPLPPMKVTITKPKENTLYIQNKERWNLTNKTIIYGPITIMANVTSEINVTRVEFYIDEKLKANVTTAPYTYLWRPLIQFHKFSLQHAIKVIAYDSLGNQASDELNVTKWRFHPLLFITGIGIASTGSGFKHTTVTGLFFNIQRTVFTTSFYAIHIHYSMPGVFRDNKGTINFKQCTGGHMIGLHLSLQMSAFNKFAYGTFTFLGDIKYTSVGLRQGITTTPSITSFRNMLQNYDP